MEESFWPCPRLGWGEYNQPHNVISFLPVLGAFTVVLSGAHQDGDDILKRSIYYLPA